MVLFLLCVALWFLPRNVSCWVLPCSLFSWFVTFLFGIVIAPRGEERAGRCASHAFVCLFARVDCCPFILPLRVRDWHLHSLGFPLGRLWHSLDFSNKVFAYIIVVPPWFLHMILFWSSWSRGPGLGPKRTLVFMVVTKQGEYAHSAWQVS